MTDPTTNAGEPSELRTAALALLDKLEALWPRDERKHFGPHWQEEADALRAAITPAPAQPEPPTAAGVEPVALTTCNCRWQGEKMVQMCTLHEAWRDAVHDWAERAKTAERRTPPTLTDAQCDAIRAEERERCAKALNIGRGDALLACGEMSAQEWRTASAMLVWLQGRIRAAAAGGG